MSFIDKKDANKKLSIWTSIITFVLGCFLSVYIIVYLKELPNKEWCIALTILLLGLNAVSIGSDLRGFLKIWKGQNDNKEEGRKNNDSKDS